MVRPYMQLQSALNYLAGDKAQEARLHVSAAIIAHSIQAGNHDISGTKDYMVWYANR